MKTITTIDELVRAHGGTEAMADWADVGASCISNWKANKRIPSGWHLRIFMDAYGRGWRLSPELFNLPEWPVQFAVRQPEPAE